MSRTYRMTEGPLFRLSLWRGDEVWRPSLHIEHWWPTGNRWHIWFLPPALRARELPSPPSAEP